MIRPAVLFLAAALAAGCADTRLAWDGAQARRAADACDAAKARNAEAAADFGWLPARPAAMASYGRRGVRFLGDALSQEVLVTEVASARNVDGTAEVSVTFATCSFTPVRVAPVVYFLDARGEVTEAHNVLPVDLPPGSTGTGIRLRSATRPATFFVEVHEARGR